MPPVADESAQVDAVQDEAAVKEAVVEPFAYRPPVDQPASASEGSASPITVGGRAMGTTWQVKLGTASQVDDVEALQQDVAARIEQLEAMMSHWRADSDVAQFAQAPAGKPMPIPVELRDVLATSLEAFLQTDGAFDVTVGPLVRLWGFGPAQRRKEPPGEKEIIEVQKTIGSQHLVLDEINPAAPRLSKKIAPLELDLSAIAKGYAIDQVAELLDRRGEQDYLIEFGGELRARGRRSPDRPWQIGLELPNAGREDVVRRVVALVDESVATSGDYRQYFADRASGRRYSHIIDPRIGRPAANGLVSVSVIAATAMRADALATALMVLGPQQGMEFAEKHNLSAVLVVERDGRLTEQETTVFDERE